MSQIRSQAALQYADDIVLLAHALSAILMLRQICDEYRHTYYLTDRQTDRQTDTETVPAEELMITRTKHKCPTMLLQTRQS